MPITPFLKNQAFQPDQIAAMNAGFVQVCIRLRLSPAADDIATRVVADRIIQAARTGVCDPRELCRRALLAFCVDDGEGERSTTIPAGEATSHEQSSKPATT